MKDKQASNSWKEIKAEVTIFHFCSQPKWKKSFSCFHFLFTKRRHWPFSPYIQLQSSSNIYIYILCSMCVVRFSLSGPFHMLNFFNFKKLLFFPKKAIELQNWQVRWKCKKGNYKYKWLYERLKLTFFWIFFFHNIGAFGVDVFPPKKYLKTRWV